MQVRITRGMKTGERRLHLLANKLDSDFFPERRFDMSSWAVTSSIWENWRSALKRARILYSRRLLERGHVKKEAKVVLHDLPLDDVCGTTACALGHATAIPELWDAGLRLTVEDYEIRRQSPGSANITLHYPDRTFTYNLGEIARDVFGINGNRANELFTGKIRSATEEAEIIRKVIQSINSNEGFAKTRV